MIMKAFALLCSAVALGCSAPMVMRSVPVPVRQAMGERPPVARWLRANRSARVGPPVAGGTLVLLGGRRAIVAPDGGVEPERVAAPEALTEIVAVPTSRGSVVVGLARAHAYRFDDPLGAGVPIVDTGVRGTYVSSVRDGAIEIGSAEGEAFFGTGKQIPVSYQIPASYWSLFYWRLRYKLVLENGHLVAVERMSFTKGWKATADL